MINEVRLSHTSYTHTHTHTHTDSSRVTPIPFYLMHNNYSIDTEFRPRSSELGVLAKPVRKGVVLP